MKHNTFVNGITFEKWKRSCSDTKNWKVDRTLIYFANNTDSKCLPSTLTHSSKRKMKSSKTWTHRAQVIFFTSAIKCFFNENSLRSLFAYTSDFKCAHTKKSGVERSWLWRRGNMQPVLRKMIRCEKAEWRTSSVLFDVSAVAPSC